MGKRKGRGSAVKKHPKLVLALIIILILIIAALAILWYFKPELFGFLTPPEQSVQTGGNNSGNSGSNGNSTGGNVNDPVQTGDKDGIAMADFSIHFPELGNKYAGDCILIDCGDTEVLIDAGSRQNSATAIKKYVDTYCTDGILEYVIATHADQDHISAFYGNSSGNTRTGIFYQYQIGTLIKFDISNKDLATKSGSLSLYGNFMEGVEMLKSQGTAVYTGSECYYQLNGAQRQYWLDDAQTLSLNVLYNYFYKNNSSDENNYSIVTLLTKDLPNGDKKHFLFTGDLEEAGEEKLVEYYSNGKNSQSEYDILPKVELYKAGHHGSKTSSSAALINVIKPAYVVVCCVAGSTEYTVENVNTFPTQQMLDTVGKYTDKIFVPSVATGLSDLGDNGKFSSQTFGGYTSLNGNVVFYFAEGEIKLYCSNNYTLLKDTDWFKEYRIWHGV